VGGADWWASRPVWFGAFALVLVGISRLVGRFEDPRPTRRPRRQRVGSGTE